MPKMRRYHSNIRRAAVGAFGALRGQVPRSRRRRLVALAAAIGAGAAAPQAVRGADPQPYKVEIAKTGNVVLDSTLDDASGLARLREKVPVGPFPLITRAQQDVGRLETVLNSFGYYKGKVDIRIDHRALNDPNLPTHLAKATTASTVSVAVDKGPDFHIGHITIEGNVPEKVRAQLGLKPGQPAVAADVFAARQRLLTALQEDGYALAKVAQPLAVEHPDANALDVTFKVTTGPRLDIGRITFTGLKTLNESFIRKRLLIHPGELYQPSKIEAARRDIASLDIIRAVTVHAGDKPAPDGRLPLTFRIEERPERTVGVTGAYSTDLGSRLRFTWTHRNLFGNAERLELSGAATGLGGTATNALGYDLSAKLTKPDFLIRNQSLETGVEALQQDLAAYTQRAYTAGASIRRPLSKIWSTSLGLSGTQERVSQESVTRDYRFISLPATLDLDSTGAAPLADPTQGWRARFGATPTMPFGVQSSMFALLRASGSTYVDVGRLWNAAPGRSIVALRALIGSIVGASQFDVPPDQRFYGGGSATVRGYAFQSISPKFADGTPAGGRSIDAGTIEFRQRLFGDFGAVAFGDVGQVSDSDAPFDATQRIGVGVGARYYTAIGPIRLDVAFPLNKPAGGDNFEIYIGIGQAF